MQPSSRNTRGLLLVFALTAVLGACRVSTSTTPADLPTELAFTGVVARPPMRDSARVDGVQGSLAVRGLLNQTPPCFSLTSNATREEARIVVRLTATEGEGTCATFAAGAFDYTAGVRGLAAGAYDVEVVHRVLFKDGRVADTVIGATRVVVR